MEDVKVAVAVIVVSKGSAAWKTWRADDDDATFWATKMSLEAKVRKHVACRCAVAGVWCFTRETLSEYAPFLQRRDVPAWRTRVGRSCFQACTESSFKRKTDSRLQRNVWKSQHEGSQSNLCQSNGNKLEQDRMAAFGQRVKKLINGYLMAKGFPRHAHAFGHQGLHLRQRVPRH